MAVLTQILIVVTLQSLLIPCETSESQSSLPFRNTGKSIRQVPRRELRSGPSELPPIKVATVVTFPQNWQNGENESGKIVQLNDMKSEDVEKVAAVIFNRPVQHESQLADTTYGSKFGSYFIEDNCWRTEVKYFSDDSGYHPEIKRIRQKKCQLKNQAKSSTTYRRKVIKIRSSKPERTMDQGRHLISGYNRFGNATVNSRSARSISSNNEPEPCPKDDSRDRPSRSYGFAYNAGTHYHWERGLANGSKVGAYAEQTADGQLRTTEYTADCRGFRAHTSLQPLNQARFLQDFRKFKPPPEARLFARATEKSQPKRSQRRQARLLNFDRFSSTTERARESVVAVLETSTVASTPRPLITTVAPVRRRTTSRQLAPIKPVRPLGSGPYHFYIHLAKNYHEERGYLNGTVQGRYGVVAPDGILREVIYESFNGFVPTIEEKHVGLDYSLSNRPSTL